MVKLMLKLWELSCPAMKVPVRVPDCQLTNGAGFVRRQAPAVALGVPNTLAALQDVLALGSDNLGLPVEFPGYEKWVLHLKLRWISLLAVQAGFFSELSEYRSEELQPRG